MGPSPELPVLACGIADDMSPTFFVSDAPRAKSGTVPSVCVSNFDWLLLRSARSASLLIEVDAVQFPEVVPMRDDSRAGGLCGFGPRQCACALVGDGTRNTWSTIGLFASILACLEGEQTEADAGSRAFLLA